MPGGCQKARSWFRPTRGPAHRPLLALRAGAAMLAATIAPMSAHANQWVIGDVEALWEYSAYTGSGIDGILVSLGNAAWGTGTTSNGASVCYARFKIVVGVAGISESTKDRMWSALLTAQSTGKKIQFYVDPSTAPYCAVNLLTIGPPLQ